MGRYRVKSKDLRGFWNPDKQTKDAERKSWKRSIKRRAEARHAVRKMKQAGGVSRREARLCLLPNDAFYQTDEWRTLRLSVIDAYGRRCMKCCETDGEIHVDHIKPRSKYPELSLTFSNLQVLCRRCNQEKSNFHETDYRERLAS